VLHAQDHAENIRVKCRGVGFRGLVGDRADLVPASSRRPATTTVAPFRAKATAAARPMPVSAPVIRTTGLSIFQLL
jgi:hypothetical protein